MESSRRRANDRADECFSGVCGKFGVGSTWPNTRLVILCLGLLNAVLLIAAVVIGMNCAKVKGSSSQVSHSAATQLISELTSLSGNHSDMLEATEEAREELRSAIKNHTQVKATTELLRAANDGYQKQIENLQVERTGLQFNVSLLEGTCGRCPPNWTLRNSSCYYFSCMYSTTLKKNWHDSREDCISRGADLVVVDNEKEQEYLSESIKSVFKTKISWTKGSWIGITDRQEEGKWVWINNVTEVEQRYWVDGEPNNHGPQGENCVCIYFSPSSPWKTWFDAKCETHMLYWICEMPSN